MHRLVRLAAGVWAGVLLVSAPAPAQTFSSGSTGALGAFDPAQNTTLTLPQDGVFNFTSINIRAGITVRFNKNTPNTPVILLASQWVTIAGTIELSGGNGLNGGSGTAIGATGGAGGPGGFNGGLGATSVVSRQGGAGLGPGGGSPGDGALANVVPGGGGGFVAVGGGITNGAAGGPAYGTPTLQPLIGGSGGGGAGGRFGVTGGAGGGGGGAILIASSDTITLSAGGRIGARGGNGGAGEFNAQVGGGGGGSGGAVRLVANAIVGNGGQVDVAGGVGTGSFGIGAAGSAGRVRVEAFSNTGSISFGTVPPATVSMTTQPGAVTLTNSPLLRITSVGGVAAPSEPAGLLASPDVTLPTSTTNPVAVALAAANIPLGTTVTVSVKGQNGGAGSAVSTGLSGTEAASTATASVSVPLDQPSIISASATFTLLAASGGGPVYADGEEVDRVRVVAALGGPSRTFYVTKSGREVPIGQAR